MAYQPPTNTSLWLAVLADEDGFITTAAEAFEEFGPESHVTVSIRCLSALPVPQTVGAVDGAWRIPGSTEHGDIAAEWQLDMVDDIGEQDHITAQLNAAQAMAAGLNGAIANAGDWNRSTELAAALHELADKFAAFSGTLPGYTNLTLHYFDGSIRQRNDVAVANVDGLAEALLGIEATDQKSAGTQWYRQAKTKLRGGLTVDIQTVIPAPADEDPEVLKARIAELEARIAGGDL